MGASFFCKRSIRSGGKARLTSFLSVSKLLPIVAAVIIAGHNSKDDMRGRIDATSNGYRDAGASWPSPSLSRDCQERCT